MSRKIDLDKPLSDEDRQYLLERNKTNLLQYADQLAREKAASDAVHEEVVEETVEETVFVDDRSYADWKVDELKEELAARSLPVSGNKDELVARLEADDE